MDAMLHVLEVPPIFWLLPRLLESTQTEARVIFPLVATTCRVARHDRLARLREPRGGGGPAARRRHRLDFQRDGERRLEPAGEGAYLLVPSADIGDVAALVPCEAGVI